MRLKSDQSINLMEGKIPTISELEQIEEWARGSNTSEAKTVLRLTTVVREVMQAKENAVALAAEFKKRAGEKGLLSLR